jgi:hypothetical protein
MARPLARGCAVAASWGLPLVTMASWLSFWATNVVALGYVYLTYPVLFAAKKITAKDATSPPANKQ